MKEFISLGKYRRRNTFVLAWGFEYMNLGGCHPRAEALKTDLKRFRISSSSFKTIHGGSESMRGSGLWRWIGEETGNVYRHKANASCWLRAEERKLSCLDAHVSPLGRNVPGVCVMKGCLPLRILTQECFRLQSGWPPPDQYSSQAFSVLFCYLG